VSIIKVKHTSIVIPDYTLGDNEHLEKMLSVWNDTCYRYDPIGFHYDEDKKQLLVPRGLDLSYLERAFRRNIEVDYKPDPYEVASFRLKVEPRDDVQKKAISYLLGEGDFSYTKKYSQQALELQTGDGKTYCVIAALTFMKVRSLIITHIDELKKQWMLSVLKMTDLDEKFLCNVDGSSTIERIMKLKDSDLKYKMFFVNHGTLQSYAKKHGWDALGEFFNKIKIGAKVIDEAHKYFENTLSVDLHTNTKKTIYLTANFERSNYKENKLFNLCFKNIARFGLETRQEKRKHIVYVAVMFNSKPSLAIQASIKGPHGFDRNKYIDYELNQPIFYDVIKFVLDYFKKKDGKTLLLFSKIEATEVIYKYLGENYTDKTIGIYNSTVSEEVKMKSLTSDIISSTPKSLGTGIDIPGLRFNVMTEPYTSPITANQTAGRLREYGPDEYTFHIELVDKGFKRVYEMYKSRQKIFKQKCVKLLELDYVPQEENHD